MAATTNTTTTTWDDTPPPPALPLAFQQAFAPLSAHEDEHPQAPPHVRRYRSFVAAHGPHVSVPLPVPPPPPRVAPTEPVPWFAKPPTEPMAFAEACSSKAITSLVLGGGLGVVMGLVLGAWQGASPPVTLPGVPDPPKIPVQWQMREFGLSLARRSTRWGRNFGVMGGVFSAYECVVEKYRAKHDVYNAAAGGCLAGATFAVNQGPAAMCFGCAGFAAFSFAMEKLMGNMGH